MLSSLGIKGHILQMPGMPVRTADGVHKRDESMYRLAV